MNTSLLDILVCPTTGGALIYDKANQELLCKSSRLAYPIHDGVPMMLPEKARSLSLDDIEKLK